MKGEGQIKRGEFMIRTAWHVSATFNRWESTTWLDLLSDHTNEDWTTLNRSMFCSQTEPIRHMKAVRLKVYLKPKTPEDFYQK